MANLHQYPIPSRGQGVKGHIVRLLNTIRPLSKIIGDGSIGVAVGADGVRLRLLGIPSVSKAFAHVRMGKILLVRAGAINVHGGDFYEVPAAVLTMGSAPECWIYVKARLDFSEITIEQASERILSDASVFRWPLLHFSFRDGSYQEPDDGPSILWEGEIHFAPLMR